MVHNMLVTCTSVAPFRVDTASRCGLTPTAFINPFTTLINICSVFFIKRVLIEKMPSIPVQKDGRNRRYPSLQSQWKDPCILTHT